MVQLSKTSGWKNEKEAVVKNGNEQRQRQELPLHFFITYPKLLLKVIVQFFIENTILWNRFT